MNSLSTLTNMISKFWWLLLLRGVVAILFGILAFVWPGMTIVFLITLFGAWAVVDGIFSLVLGIKQYGEQERWWATLISGILSIAVGILTFLWPGTTGLVLLWFIAFWAIITGIFHLVAAIRLRKVIETEWLLGFSGVMSILFGLILILRPGVGALAVIWIIGLFAIINGLILIALSLKLKNLGQK